MREQAYGPQSGNDRGTVHPNASQCSIKMIADILFEVQKLHNGALNISLVQVSPSNLKE